MLKTIHIITKRIINRRTILILYQVLYQVLEMEVEMYPVLEL